MSDENLTPRPLKIRKQRQSIAIIPTDRCNPKNGPPLSLLPPASCNGGKVMTNDAVHQQAEYSQLQLGPEYCRRPSLKHRLLKRMMSGTATRTQTNSMNGVDERNEHQPSTAKSSRHTSRGSTASSDPNIYRLDDLDSALAAFPTPPTSNATSPSSDQSLDSFGLRPQTYRALCTPCQGEILAAELRVILCRDHPMADQSTLALIEISTIANRRSFDHILDTQQSALDIAIVIDNSLFNSPASLMASCETASLLTSFLNTTTDRIMVLCTAPADPNYDTFNPSIILPLGRINPRNLKAKLDSITISMAQPNPGAMATVLESAQQVLVRSDRSCCYNTFGHIIILTAHTSALRVEGLRHQNLQTHVLFVGLPLRREWDEIECNGWKMCLYNAILNRDHPCRSRSKSDRDPRSLSNSLHQLIDHARLGKLPSFLTDIILDIEPQSGYSIAKTMGSKIYSKIQMGEVKTVLVRLQPTGHRGVSNCVEDSRRHRVNASLTSDNPVAALDQMLRPPKDGMVTAMLKYKHSSLPANTICMTTTRRSFQTPPLPHEDEGLARRPVSSKTNTLFHQLLAEHYATFFKPRDALLSLQRDLGEGGWYMTAVTDELRYQARIYDRIAIENSPKKPLSRYDGSGPGTQPENRSTPFSCREDCKPRDQISAPNEDIFVPCTSPFKVAEQLGLDDARKLWSDLYNMSRGGTKTVSKKGSIGGTSLRSLSTPARIPVFRGVSAPWL